MVYLPTFWLIFMVNEVDVPSIEHLGHMLFINEI